MVLIYVRWIVNKKPKRMTHFQYWIISALILLNEDARPILAEDYSKIVCSKDSIPLFENITVDSIEAVASLYIQASTDRLLAMLSFHNFTTSRGYSKKLFLDINGHLCIRNASSSDEARYILKIGKGKSVDTKTMYLRVHDAPTKNCKPKIKLIEDVLVASLEANECGKPLVSVDWLNNLGSHSEGKDSFRLPSKNKAGTYYACISGPAVRCARTSKLSDYCTAFRVEDTHQSQDINTEPCAECSPAKYVLVILIVIIAEFILGLIGFVVWRCPNAYRYYIRKNTNLDKKSETPLTHAKVDYTSKSDSGIRLSEPSLECRTSEEFAVCIQQEDANTKMISTRASEICY